MVGLGLARLAASVSAADGMSEMKISEFVERWSSAIKGLFVFAAVSGAGALAIYTYQMYWAAGGLVAGTLNGGSAKAVMIVEDHVAAAGQLLPVILLGAGCLGVAVWIMDAVAQRLGPPYSD